VKSHIHRELLAVLQIDRPTGKKEKISAGIPKWQHFPT
jgi:hypothetical protein